MLNHDKALQFSARLRAGEDFSLDTGDQEPFCSNRNSVVRWTFKKKEIQFS